MALLHLSLFASFQLTVKDQRVSRFRSLREPALLAYLAVEAGAPPHRRQTLAGLLWPDQPAEKARDNLNQTLVNLRTALRDRELNPPFLLSVRHTVAFNPASDAWLDVREFTAALAATAAHAHSELTRCATCTARLADAILLYHGPFLGDFSLPESDLFEEWLLLKREWFHYQAITALGQLSEFSFNNGAYEQALRYAERQVELDPLNEPAQRNVLRALAWSGQRTTALTRFETYRVRLDTALAVAPSAETLALVEEIRTGAFDKMARLRLGAQPEGWQDDKVTNPANHPVTLSPSHPAALSQRQDWGGAVESALFIGREKEIETLTGWLRTGAKVIAVLGIGGVGKTALALRVARGQAGHFDFVIWRSLINAPPPATLFANWLHILSSHTLTPPDDLDSQLALLFEQLRQQRCLLVLDNVESILQDQRVGRYRPGYEFYGQLLRRFGLEQHQSCLLLTSREQPLEISSLDVETPAVRTLELAGLPMTDGQQLLQVSGLATSAQDAVILVQRYSGHPLSLRLVARTIHELFQDDVAAFLSQETPIFGDIRDLFEQHRSRLTQLERVILMWLALEREPVPAATLRAALVPSVSNSAFLETLDALQRRLLLEQSPRGFTLQNVVMEGLTDRCIELIEQEICQEEWGALNSFALAKAQAPEYVRQSQVRVILEPIAARLITRLGQPVLLQKLQRVLTQLRSRAPRAPGYAAGNILNLLLHLGVDVRGYDFSQLSVWQAYLRGANVPGVDFTGSDLAGSLFTDTFRVINALAFHPDGGRLAAATDDAIRLWQTGDWQPIGNYPVHRSMVYSVVYSPDGRLLASGSGDHTVGIGEAETGQRLHLLVGHADVVRCVSFRPQGDILASSGADQTIRLWAVESGQLIHVLRGHTGLIRQVAFSPDGQYLVSGSRDHTVRLWDVRRGDCLQVWQGHERWVECVAFSPDGAQVASGSWDQTVRLWDVRRGQSIARLHGHTDLIRAVTFHPAGAYLASASADQTVRVWDLHTGQTSHTLLGHTGVVDCLAFHPQGTSLASGGESLRLWDASSGQTLHTIHGHIQSIASLAFSPDGHLLAAGCPDKQVRVWDVQSRQLIHTSRGRLRWIRQVAFHPKDHLLAGGGGDRSVLVWDAQRWQLLDELHGHTNAVEAVAFHPEGALLASGSWDHTVRIWDLATGRTRHVLQGHTGPIDTIAFSPDGRTLVSGSHDQTVRIWDVQRAEALYVLHGHTGFVKAVACSPDGRRCISAGSDHAIRVWDVHSGEMVGIFAGHSHIVEGLAFSPDGTLFASSSWDRTVRVWNIHTGQTIHTLHGHDAVVNAVAFHPNGWLLASGCFNETIKLWDVRTGGCLVTLRAPGPYAGMKITGATGITETQRAALKALGAVS